MIYGNVRSGSFEGSVPVASYDITSDSDDRSRLHSVRGQRAPLDSFMEPFIERRSYTFQGTMIVVPYAFFMDPPL